MFSFLSRKPRREYDVGHFEGHDHAHSELADVTGAGLQDSVGNQETLRRISACSAPGSGVDPELDSDEVETLDSALLGQISSQLETGWTDWAVTDGDAREAVAMIEGASAQQQALLVNALRESGELDTLMDNLPAEDRETLSASVASLTATERVETLMDTGWIDWAVTDGEATEALELIADLAVCDQARVLSELDDGAFTSFVENIPEDRYADLQAHYEASQDPERKLQIWELLHEGRAHTAQDAQAEEAPSWLDRSDDADLTRHHNDQLDAIVAGTEDEIAAEVAHLQERLDAGEPVSLAEVEALDARKQQELGLEMDYGVNLTNDPGQGGLGFLWPETERRVWSQSELEQLESVFSRMPEEHLKDNLALTEIQRMDVRRDQDGLGWEERPSVGADAGGGLIRFYDTGTGFDAASGTNTVEAPWRLGTVSELAGHDAGSSETSLIEEVLSHEAGHTVHQGDDALWQRWQDISSWQRLSDADVQGELVGGGMSAADATTAVSDMESTRDGHYTTRSTTSQDGTLFEVDPYSSGFLSVQSDAIPAGSDWDYARSNPEDHFAELYTKAIHAPESLHADLISGPQSAVSSAEANHQHMEEALAYVKENGGSEAEVLAAEQMVAAALEDLEGAQETAEVREEQWAFFRAEVFGADDSDIQAMQPPSGKESVYAEFQQLAEMCMTPQQLDALRERYADQL